MSTAEDLDLMGPRSQQRSAEEHMPDPCDAFARSLDAQIQYTERKKNDTIFVGILGVLGLDFVWDLIKGDDAWRKIVEAIVAAALAGAIFRLLGLLARLFQRLGLGKRLATAVGRFFPWVLAALIAYQLYETYGEIEKLQTELEEFALALAADPVYRECPPERINQILRSHGLPVRR